jgi:hypothetical protein
MKRPTRRAAWLIACSLGLAIAAPPARAQFEEPDTVPRFAVGVTGEIVFRGTRGELDTGTEVSFGGGPVVGARLEYRVTRTLTVGVAGGWGRLDERLEDPNTRTVSAEGFSQLQFTGEFLLRVKPNIPGYFILGGGARRVDPDSKDPVQYQHNVRTFTEGMGVVGAGVELGSRRARTFKLDFRFYLVSPAEQIKFETKSVATDFAITLGLLFRV